MQEKLENVVATSLPSASSSVFSQTANVSRKMPSTAKLTQVITWFIFFPSPFLIKHQLFLDIFVRFVF